MKISKVIFTLVGMLIQLFLILNISYISNVKLFIYESIIFVILFLVILGISTIIGKDINDITCNQMAEGMMIILLISANHYIIAFIWLIVDLNLIMEG